MTLVHHEDVEAVRGILSEHFKDADDDRIDAAIRNIAAQVSSFRPKPKVPPRRVPEEGEIPTLHGDDIFRITGRGVVVTLNLDNTPIKDVSPGDHVKFDETTKCADQSKERYAPREVPSVYPGVVYKVTGVERHAIVNPGPLVGLLVKEVGYELQ